MQEQKINYITLQNNYEEIEIALYFNEQLLNKKTIHKNEASKTLLITIDSLLNSYNLIINDLNFIGVNKGPGPFTTLRVVIATVNALNFAIKIPLIGIDGLDAFISEYEDSSWPVTIVLLNAFNNDVYYVIKNSNQKLTGWKNINELLEDLKNQISNQKIKFLGNGANLFETQIKEIFADNVYIPQPNPQTCSIEEIAKIALTKYLNKEDLQDQIIPLYLKDAVKINK